ncbi:MAG: hypothetical protein EBT86_12485, partial [Actinobacteria bacterium]|nr:hypothetical protein [Actinomycetota bacterium]
RFVKDYEAGRIPREDVERALQTERQLLQLPPLTFLGSPQAKIAQQQIPGPTIQQVKGYKPRGERELPPPFEPTPPPVTPPVDPEEPPSEEVTSIQEFKNRVPGDRKSAELETLVNKANLSQVIEYFKKHKNPFFVRVAELMDGIQKQVKLTKPKNLPGAAGQYNFVSDQITMDKRYVGDELVMIHEMVHALVARSQLYPSPQQRKFVREIKALRDYAEKALRKKGKLIDPRTGRKWYAFNVDRDPNGLGLEFVTEAMSYPEFQYELMQIPYTQSQTIWSKFVEAVASLLGIKSKNALSEIISLVESLSEMPRPKVPGFPRKSGEELLSNREGQPSGKPPVIRIDPGKKNINQKFPELQEAARKYARGEITPSDYAALVNSEKFLGEVREYDFVPAPATDADAQLALNKNQILRWKQTENIKPGTEVGLRLDINAYQNHGVWVNSIHPKDGKVVYAAVSRITNAIFPNAGAKALKVATGETVKSPFARIEGNWSPISNEDAVKLMQDVFYDPEWTQVGYNPIRHSYFFDRATGDQVVSADEVIQIGPLVLAKNAVIEEIGSQEGVLYSAEEGVEPESLKTRIISSAKQAMQKREPLKLAPQVTGEAAQQLQATFAPENKTIIDK